jgi:hypothetical protein
MPSHRIRSHPLPAPEKTGLYATLTTTCRHGIAVAGSDSLFTSSRGFQFACLLQVSHALPLSIGDQRRHVVLEKCVREGENDCCPGNERLVHLLGPLVALRCLLCSHCLENLLGPGCDVLRRTCNDLMMDNIWGPTD